MLRELSVLCAAMMTVCAASPARAAQPTSRPVANASVQGAVSAESEVPLSEMVVYLE
jgi:hypothetical protein